MVDHTGPSCPERDALLALLEESATVIDLRSTGVREQRIRRAQLRDALRAVDRCRYGTKFVGESWQVVDRWTDRVVESLNPNQRRDAEAVAARKGEENAQELAMGAEVRV